MSDYFKDSFQRIAYSDPSVLSGTQCFRGTRVPVSLVLDYLSLGWAVKDIGEAFPSVKPEYVVTLLKLYSKEIDNLDAKKR